MSHTYKQCPWDTMFRRPRGKTNALRNNARKGAIPPDSWDDKHVDNQCWLPIRIAKALIHKGWNSVDACNHLIEHYKVPRWMANEIIKWEETRYKHWWPKGTILTYKEKKDEINTKEG